LSGNDFPNTLGIGFTYDVPKFAKGNSLLGRSVNGFLLSGVYRYRSGQVYAPYQQLPSMETPATPASAMGPSTPT